MLHLLSLFILKPRVVLNELLQLLYFFVESFRLLLLLCNLLVGVLHVLVIFFALVLQPVDLTLADLEFLAHAVNLLSQFVVHFLEDFLLFALLVFESLDLVFYVLIFLVVLHLVLFQ